MGAPLVVAVIVSFVVGSFMFAYPVVGVRLENIDKRRVKVIMWAGAVLMLWPFALSLFGWQP